MPEGTDVVQSLVQDTCGERTEPEPETSTCRVRCALGGATDSSCRDVPEQATPKAAATTTTDADRMGPPDEDLRMKNSHRPACRHQSGARRHHCWISSGDI